MQHVLVYPPVTLAPFGDKISSPATDLIGSGVLKLQLKVIAMITTVCTNKLVILLTPPCIHTS